MIKVEILEELIKNGDTFKPIDKFDNPIIKLYKY